MGVEGVHELVASLCVRAVVGEGEADGAGVRVLEADGAPGAAGGQAGHDGQHLLGQQARHHQHLAVRVLPAHHDARRHAQHVAQLAQLHLAEPDLRHLLCVRTEAQKVSHATNGKGALEYNDNTNNKSYHKSKNNNNIKY